MKKNNLKIKKTSEKKIRRFKKVAIPKIKKKIEKKISKKKQPPKELLKKKKGILKKEKRLNLIVLVKSEENPIIEPKPTSDWENWQTFNPGVILLNNKVHFLYRAIGRDGLSRFGYAVSNDGLIIDERLPQPVYEHSLTHSKFNYYSLASGGSFGGAEDPRLVRVDEEDKVYLSYTACDEGLRVALTSIKIKDFLEKKWKWRVPKLISPPDQVHKNWVIFPEKIGKPIKQYAILHSISPEILITYRPNLEFQEGEYIQSYYNGNSQRKNCWDSYWRGAGAPPLKTTKGWLLFYHALDKDDPGKYKVGALLLDLNDPTKIICRSPEPILEPTENYENNGYKGGVVYLSGAIIKNEELLVYYGASDSYVGVAQANLKEFIQSLTQKIKPKLKIKILKKKRNDY